MAYVASFNLDGVPADELDSLLSAQAEELRCRVAQGHTPDQIKAFIARTSCDYSLFDVDLDFQAGGVAALSKSIRITVGSTGRYYEVGRRGAIKTEEALRKLLVKDIADGYFGQSVIPNAPSIIDQAVKVYRKLTEEDNE